MWHHELSPTWSVPAFYHWRPQASFFTVTWNDPLNGGHQPQKGHGISFGFKRSGHDLKNLVYLVIWNTNPSKSRQITIIPKNLNFSGTPPLLNDHLGVESPRQWCPATLSEVSPRSRCFVAPWRPPCGVQKLIQMNDEWVSVIYKTFLEKNSSLMLLYKTIFLKYMICINFMYIHFISTWWQNDLYHGHIRLLDLPYCIRISFWQATVWTKQHDLAWNHSHWVWPLKGQAPHLSQTHSQEFMN